MTNDLHEQRSHSIDRLTCLRSDLDERFDCNRFAAQIPLLRCVAIGDYILDGSVMSFRDRLAEAASIRLELIDRKLAGEAVDEVHVDEEAFRSILDSLASGQWELAKDLAIGLSKLSPNHAEENLIQSFNAIGCRYINALFIALEACLRHAICGDEERFQYWLARFAEYEPGRAYYIFLNDLANPSVGLGEALSRVERTHRRWSRQHGGLFFNSAEAFLSIWGVGLVNLARYRGRTEPINFTPTIVPELGFDHDVIPRELFVST